MLTHLINIVLVSDKILFNKFKTVFVFIIKEILIFNYLITTITKGTLDVE